MADITDYIADYLSSEHYLFLTAPIKEHAEQLLNHFAVTTPFPYTLPGIEKTLTALAQLDLPLLTRKEIPNLLEAFFSFLQTSGSMPGADAWGAMVLQASRSFQERFREDGTVKGETFRKRYTDVNRNDPCPCGSGKKFKKCCMGLIG